MLSIANGSNYPILARGNWSKLRLIDVFNEPIFAMKIEVICRVEPGCLGPDGADHVEAFCKMAQKEFDAVDPCSVEWQLIPRWDKTKPEVQFKLAGKMLNDQQAKMYLSAMGREYDDFESGMFKQLTTAINHYFGR